MPPPPEGAIAQTGRHTGTDCGALGLIARVDRIESGAIHLSMPDDGPTVHLDLPDLARGAKAGDRVGLVVCPSNSMPLRARDPADGRLYRLDGRNAAGLRGADRLVPGFAYGTLLGLPVLGWLMSIFVAFFLVVAIAGNRRVFPPDVAPRAARRSLLVFPLYLAAAVAGTAAATLNPAVGIGVMWFGCAAAWWQFFVAVRKALDGRRNRLDALTPCPGTSEA